MGSIRRVANGPRDAVALVVTADGLVVVSSEAGSVALDASRVTRRGRLGQGEMVVVDTVAGTIVGPGAELGAPPAASVAPRRLPSQTPHAWPPADERVRVAMPSIGWGELAAVVALLAIVAVVPDPLGFLVASGML